MHSETCYISCNANQTPTIVDWGKNNLICYGACNAVMIYDSNFGSGGRVISNLVGHTNRINSVRWIRNNENDETELISGSSDHTAIVWSLKDNKYVPCVLKGHESNVNIVDGLNKGPNFENTIVITVSMDSTVRIWLRPTLKDDFLVNQTLNYGYSICTSVRLSFLPKTNRLILALAPDTSTIDLYIENDASGNCTMQLNKAASLKGHEDWIRGLDFTLDDKEDLILASSSQDMYIRLWRITSSQLEDSSVENLIKTESATAEYRVYVDSVLTGHEGWVYSVNWKATSCKFLQLLSTSLDKTMVIWEIDPGSNLWLEKVRLGEVGGNTLGFYGGVFSPDGQSVLAHSYHGAFHIWHNVCDEWVPQVTIGGHFSDVCDLAWDPTGGEFLISIGTDQTTRIHAPWQRSADKEATWHEIARPQVHGYDMSALAALSRYKFASASEEKVIRTFEAPAMFRDNFRRICKVTEDEQDRKDDSPKGASVPSLGLSNKAIFTNSNNSNEKGKKEGYEGESHFQAVELNEPPTEETLLQNTLWPEIQKLYGHGYEVYSLAAAPNGRFLASACKATTQEHAAILLWDTSNWKLIQKLISHTLTVAQISFSPDSQHILSVSRDRRWSLFTKNTNEFELAATTDKKTSVHTRIIWSCAWAPNSKYFATGSRDGKVCVWHRNKDKIKNNLLNDYELASNHLELKNDSITALAFAPSLLTRSSNDCYLIAIGLESGGVVLYKWQMATGWDLALALDKSEGHHLTVKRLAFRPVFGCAGRKPSHSTKNNNIIQLASCGSDSCVKVHNITIE